MKVRDLVKKLKAAGWELDRIRGSHHVFVHHQASRSVTIAVHGKDIPDFFAREIIRQAYKALFMEKDQ